jgi:hypothetical protein
LKKRLWPNISGPPTALKDPSGRIITSNSELEELRLSTYVNLLENRPMKEGLEKHKETSEKLFQLRFEKAKNTKTKNWTMSHLLKVLKELKLK